MDGVSTAASVLGIAGTALKCSQTIYKLLASIKNQPRHIRNLTSAVQNLQLVLSRVTASTAVRFVGDANDLEPLSIVLRSCWEDIHHYEGVIRRITLVHNDSRVGRSWKLVRSVLQEKDLQKMWTELHHHFGMISICFDLLHLSSAQRNAIQVREQTT